MLELLTHDGDDVENSLSLCVAAARFTSVSGAGVLLATSGPNYTPFCASDEHARSLLETEVTLGEGPGLDVCRSNLALDDVNLTQTMGGRWMVYARAAVDIGVRSVFGFPLTIGAIRIGALVLYGDDPGPLSESQESDAYVAASVVARAILNWRAGVSRELLTTDLGLTLSFDFSVHQAAGMVAVQANLGLSDAMVLLRAHAIGTGITMTDLAKSVVSREIGYDVDSHTWHDVDAPTG
jgi:GAF domain-containing protein